MMVLTMTNFKGIVIIDAGHGNNTPGKRSPKWKGEDILYEWIFNRRVANILRDMLQARGVKTAFTHYNQIERKLSDRVFIANQYYKENPDSFLISIHANAGGGTGWECFTSPGLTHSDEIASYFCFEAGKKWGDEWAMRFDDSDGDHDKEERFYILTQTKCPAVLTENFFMDTYKDFKYISSDRGVAEVAEVHFNAIMNYLNDKYGDN